MIIIIIIMIIYIYAYNYYSMSRRENQLFAPGVCYRFWGA